MNYKIINIQDRIIEDKVNCVMFVYVTSNEISSTSFSIEFELTSSLITKDFIEQKIKEKIEQIKKVEKMKKEKNEVLQQIKKKFIYAEGKI